MATSSLSGINDPGYNHRILIAPDKFKGSLSAREVAEHIAAGLREVLPGAQVATLPVSDGGEGFAELICEARHGSWHECEAHDALGRRVRARFGTIDDGATAIMEMSEAAGLWRLSPGEREPLRATTFGVGEMLLAAAKRGVDQIFIGLGGSATNDGGFGLARALGFRFLNAQEKLTDQLQEVSGIIRPNEWLLPPVVAAVDVRNPLLGPRGATRVFGPQKGVIPDLIEPLEAALARFARVVGGDPDLPGAGAAGGLGFGLTNLCGAELRPGFEVVAEQIGLRDTIAAHEVIITGEGRLDAQTWEGKAPDGVARLARERGKTVFAIVGSASAEGAELFNRVFSLMRPPVSEAEAIANAAKLLGERAGELGQFLRDEP